MNLPLLSGLKFIRYAIDQENESKLWEMWISRYPFMNKDDFISFDDFRKQVIKKKPHKQTEDEMMMMAKAINAAFNGEVVEG